jgi:hypothetical protein
MIRFLINDVDKTNPVFEDEEINAILALEGGVVKLAAAQIIDTNADNELLASKVLRTQDLTTDGAKAAQVMHARAEQLRNQHFDEIEDDDDYLAIVEAGPDRSAWYF